MRAKQLCVLTTETRTKIWLSPFLGGGSVVVDQLFNVQKSKKL